MDKIDQTGQAGIEVVELMVKAGVSASFDYDLTDDSREDWVAHIIRSALSAAKERRKAIESEDQM